MFNSGAKKLLAVALPLGAVGIYYLNQAKPNELLSSKFKGVNV